MAEELYDQERHRLFNDVLSKLDYSSFTEIYNLYEFDIIEADVYIVIFTNKITEKKIEFVIHIKRSSIEILEPLEEYESVGDDNLLSKIFGWFCLILNEIPNIEDRCRELRNLYKEYITCYYQSTIDNFKDKNAKNPESDVFKSDLRCIDIEYNGYNERAIILHNDLYDVKIARHSFSEACLYIAQHKRSQDLLYEPLNDIETMQLIKNYIKFLE